MSAGLLTAAWSVSLAVQIIGSRAHLALPLAPGVHGKQAGQFPISPSMLGTS